MGRGDQLLLLGQLVCFEPLLKNQCQKIDLQIGQFVYTIQTRHKYLKFMLTKPKMG